MYLKTLKTVIMSEQIGNLSKQTETTPKCKNLEWKIQNIKQKDRLGSWKIEEERVNELEEKSKEIIQDEEKRRA